MANGFRLSGGTGTETSLKRLLSAVAVAVFWAACGGGDDRPPPSDFTFDDLPDGGPRPDGGEALDGGDEEPMPSEADLLEPRVAGHYAIRTVVASIVKPPVGSEKASTTTSLIVGQIRRVGEQFELVERPCRARSSDPEITLSDALTRAVGETVVQLGFGAEASGELRFVRPQNTVVVGARLNNPDRDPLPKVPGPPEFDADNDGKPGVTVKKSGFPSGDIYVVQRQRSSYGGSVVRDGRLEGLVVSNVEQEVLDHTMVVFGSKLSNDQVNAPTRQDPDASKSTVVMVRQPAALTCEALIEQANALFN
jgi:hypothetical protein